MKATKLPSLSEHHKDKCGSWVKKNMKTAFLIVIANNECIANLDEPTKLRRHTKKWIVLPW